MLGINQIKSNYTKPNQIKSNQITKILHFNEKMSECLSLRGPNSRRDKTNDKYLNKCIISGISRPKYKETHIL